ncbi:hypothetical protein GOV13_04180 [Candidatus Pacearchaeota archaeon]|nr:hypothetical protein [Candidatus Pacearchaeota archaeon]
MENEEKPKVEEPMEKTEEPKETVEKPKEKVVEKVQEKAIGEKQDVGETLTDMVREKPWMVSTLVLSVIVLIFLFSSFVGPTGNAITGSVVAGADAGQALLDFANSQGAEAELLGVEDVGEFYEVILSINGQETPLMVTKDGEYFLSGSLVPLQSVTPPSQPSSPTGADVPKSDKPKAELFIMTHCPYGTQAEKGFIPAIKALGDTADVKIRFVHYFMHEQPGQEPDETPKQVCIREEQPDKWLDYLECFLKEGDSSSCLREVNINMADLNTCINTGKADEYYAEDSALSQSYGVGGSPTMVINGVRFAPSAQSCSASQQESGECIIYPIGRDSASYLSGICESFNDAPEECALELSSASPSPGFGYSTTGSATSAQC